MTIFDYTDYRLFLRDYYAKEKRENSKFSYRYFAKLAKFKSSAFLKLVIEGKRNLAPAMIHQFAKALKLAAKETDYFESLVLFDQAQDGREKKHHADKIAKMRPAKPMQGLTEDQLKYYEKKYYVVIREMVALPHFKEDPAWIALQLVPPIKPDEAREAVEVLLRLGLLARDASGRLRHGDVSVATPLEVESNEVFQFQRGMIDNARVAMTLFPGELRDISSLTLPLPAGRLEEASEMIREFQTRFLRHFNECDEKKLSGVFQFNCQLFPVTRVRM